MPLDSDVGQVDAVIDIVKNSSGSIPPDSGIPSGDFVYADFNSNGTVLENGGTVMSTVAVGNGGSIMDILSSNGNILNGVKEALEGVNVTLGTDGIKVNGVDNIKGSVDSLKDSIKEELTKTVSNQLKIDKTIETVLGNVSVKIDESGIKVSNATKDLKDILSSKDMSPTVNNTVDVSALATANNIIAGGVQKQKEYHDKQITKADKQIDELDFNKNGSSTLIDVDNNQIIPRNAIAQHNAEKAIETKDMNNTTMDDILDFTGDLLSWGSGEANDLIGGGLGENASINPFEFLLNQVKEEEEKQLANLKQNLRS